MPSLVVYSDLQHAIQLYFDVLHECDLGKLDSVFHPLCNLATNTNGVISMLPLPKYREIVAGRTAPSKLGRPREESVDSIQAVSEDVAVVLLSSRVLEKRFRDILCFVREDAAWKIVSKTYALHEIVESE